MVADGRLARVVLLLALAVTAASCSAPSAGTPTASAPVPGVSGTASPGPPGGTASRGAPAKAFAVGVRTLKLSRGASRPLPTTVWYPAAGQAGRPPRSGAPAAAGRFPVVVFSHGLHGLPEYYAPVTTRWAAAGFVVAAPAYPYTSARSEPFRMADITNQPADASHVLERVLALDKRRGDVLAGHLDPARLGAGGHSAGGYTTSGMFGAGHDRRLKAGIVIAGGTLGPFGGPSAALLFVHGERDETVPVAAGRDAYDRVPWPKAFLTLVGGDHGQYLSPVAGGFDETISTTTDFLRWALYGDPAARARLLRTGTDLARFTSALG